MHAILALMELEDAIFEEMHRRWSKQREYKCNHKVLTQLYLHLSNEHLCDVHEETFTYKLWLQLEEMCMEKIVSKQMFAKEMFIWYLHV